MKNLSKQDIQMLHKKVAEIESIVVVKENPFVELLSLHKFVLKLMYKVIEPKEGK